MDSGIWVQRDVGWVVVAIRLCLFFLVSILRYHIEGERIRSDRLHLWEECCFSEANQPSAGCARHLGLLGVVYGSRTGLYGVSWRASAVTGRHGRELVQCMENIPAFFEQGHFTWLRCYLTLLGDSPFSLERGR